METYPIEFLKETIAAERDDRTLDALVDRYDARWVFSEHDRPRFRDRIVHLIAKGWAPVYVDSEYIIVVRPSPETSGYVAAHRVDLARVEPGDLVPRPVALRAQQRAGFARVLAALGQPARFEEQRRAALAEAGAAAEEAFASP
jgi:hypothetical protein